MPEWERRYLSTDPNEMAFGGRVEIFLRDGTTLVDEMAVANAHPLGAKPFTRPDYIAKFRTLTDGVITPREAARFLEAAENLAKSEGGGTVSAECRAAGRRIGGWQAGNFLTCVHRHGPRRRAIHDVPSWRKQSRGSAACAGHHGGCGRDAAICLRRAP